MEAEDFKITNWRKEMTKFIVENWEYIMLGFVVLEKIVKATPTKKDDVIFDMIIIPIFNSFKKKAPKK